MVFFPEPLRPSEGREEDHIVVDPIEADKKTGEKSVDWQLPDEQTLCAIYGALLIFMNGMISLLSSTRSDDSIEQVSEDSLVTSVQALKEIFYRLKKQDQSESSTFSQNFSEVWHTLIQGVQIMDRTKRGSYINTKKLKELLADMELYPQDEEHKLGFYLGEYAGEIWLPIPYRNILKELHMDHYTRKDQSTLTKWSELIIEILQG